MIALIGRSGSGKSTIQKELEKKGYKKVVMATTRPKREGEVDGEDYYFLSEEEWLLKAKNKIFVDSACYNKWYYGLEIPKDNEKAVVCVTPAGFRCLKRNGYNVISVYIDVDRRIALIKSLERGDIIEEAYRRNVSDVGQFDRVEEEVDIVIKNDFNTPVEILAERVLNSIKEL